MTLRIDNRRRGVALALLSVVLGLIAGQAGATDIRHWSRKPIEINLPVGRERIIVLGAPVRVGLPKKLAASGSLRVQSTGGAIYLKAKKPFKAARVQLQDANNGRIILVDLTAKTHASDQTIRIVSGSPDRQSNAGGDRESSHRKARGRRRPGEDGAPEPVRLVRHAAQALYAPRRVIEPAGGIARVHLKTRSTLTDLLPSLPVTATPLAAWRGGGYIVTAVELTNRDRARRFTLDPHAVQGDFVAASFMQHTLGPAGTDADTTTLFAVTEHGGLRAAMQPPAGATRSTDNEADDGNQRQ